MFLRIPIISRDDLESIVLPSKILTELEARKVMEWKTSNGSMGYVSRIEGFSTLIRMGGVPGLMAPSKLSRRDRESKYSLFQLLDQVNLSNTLEVVNEDCPGADNNSPEVLIFYQDSK
jgi:hypothetical protein